MNIPWEISDYINAINKLLSNDFKLNYTKNNNGYDLYINFKNELIEYILYECSKEELYKVLKAIYSLLTWGGSILNEDNKRNYTE